ncbi:squalene monooxygenase-like [Plakobranchus ocellatus]|uniref:Squalene monooxygenase n=1 Tax=Plakobranchus ocellatus TaxID=259542 RepID=A0AAV3Y8X9_9GAST|nr:squalene monooxygenase-like [Plakobranchus ocellatus]
MIRMGTQTFSNLVATSVVLPLIASILTALAGIIYLFYRQNKRPAVTKPSHVFRGGDREVIIIGSGVGGSAMANVLARDGRKVTVIERDLKQPDRIVGELLQPGGVRALSKLGLADCTHNLDAHEIKGYVIHNLEAKTEVVVPYPREQGNDDATKNITSARAFHHGRFITSLRERAQKEPNVTYIEGTATKLVEDNGVVVGVQYKPKGEDELKTIHAPLTFVVDGCFSKFRKMLVKEPVHVASHFVGFLMHHCPQKISNHAELVLTDPNPILVYQISSESTRILVDIRGVMPKNLKDYLLDSVCPQLPEHIQEPFRDGVINGRVRSMPNSFLPPSFTERPGVLVLGDAYNMRHPLTGGGMSVCLNDVVIWRQLLRGIPDLTDYEAIINALRVFHLRRKNNHSFVVNVLAQALYELFAAKSKHLVSMKKACFEYFRLGGKCVAGPVSLLSVLDPKPHILIGHFFAVAVYAVYFVYQSEPLWALHRTIYRSVMILLSACGILFPLLWGEIKCLITL